MLKAVDFNDASRALARLTVASLRLAKARASLDVDHVERERAGFWFRVWRIKFMYLTGRPREAANGGH